jgi:hypothetical protein
MLELALTCLEGAALGRSLMVLQEAADDSEARAAAALELAAGRFGDIAAMTSALDAVTAFADAERAELAAAARWAEHVSTSQELARRALMTTTDSVP